VGYTPDARPIEDGAAQGWSVLLKQERHGCNMLGWALTFLIVALIAAALGFGVVAGTAASIAKILFIVFLALFLISLVAPRFRPPAA
jgi:uncharacterized membrane protein YtjA (UPF0391 family)